MSLFINDDTMSKFDVIGGGGPCTLQRNTPYFVNLFKKKNRTINAFTFDETRSTNLNLIYDEWGMQDLCHDKKHFLIYNETFLPHFMYEEVICNIQQHFDCFNEGSSVRASGG